MKNKLNENDIFINLLYSSKVNIHQLYRDIPQYNNYIEGHNDVGISFIDITKKKLTTSLFNIVKENEYNVNDKSLIVIKPSKDKNNNIIFIPNKNSIIDIGKSLNLDIDIINTNHPFYSSSIIYNFIVSIIPNIIHYTPDYKFKIINNFCNKLSYGITDKRLFDKFNYKSLISRNKIQMSLIDNNLRFNIHYREICTILSDYFNVNIILLIENILVYTSHHNNKNLSCIFIYSNKKYSILMNNKYSGLFPPTFINLLETYLFTKTNLHPIIRLEPLSKYKLEDILLLSKALNIQLVKTNDTINNKEKKRTKLELYNDIVLFFPE